MFPLHRFFVCGWAFPSNQRWCIFEQTTINLNYRRSLKFSHIHISVYFDIIEHFKLRCDDNNPSWQSNLKLEEMDNRDIVIIICYHLHQWSQSPSLLVCILVHSCLMQSVHMSITSPLWVTNARKTMKQGYPSSRGRCRCACTMLSRAASKCGNRRLRDRRVLTNWEVKVALAHCRPWHLKYHLITSHRTHATISRLIYAILLWTWSRQKEIEIEREEYNTTNVSASNGM